MTDTAQTHRDSAQRQADQHEHERFHHEHDDLPERRAAHALRCREHFMLMPADQHAGGDRRDHARHAEHFAREVADPCREHRCRDDEIVVLECTQQLHCNEARDDAHDHAAHGEHGEAAHGTRCPEFNAAATAKRNSTRPVASLSRLSPSSRAIRQRGSTTRSSTAFTSTASGGDTTAPSAKHAAHGRSGTTRCT